MSALLIRCDGSGRLGFGHVSRCLCLADELRLLGMSTTFAMRALDGEAVHLVQGTGFQVAILPSEPLDHRRVGEDDLSALLDVADDRRASAILVDHYGASEAYLERIRGGGFGLGVIDDTGERDLSAAQWVLNQNLGAEKLPMQHMQGATILCGPMYALLRPEFARAREHLNRSFPPIAGRVLVTLGGGDVATESRDALSALEPIARSLEIRVLARKAFDVPGPSHHNVSVIEKPQGVAPHMAWADLSVNGGGSSCWELACLGVPMVILALSSDQQGNARALEDGGVAVRAHPGSPDSTARTVEALLVDVSRRRAMSTRASTLVDGMGAARAAQSLAETISQPRRH